MKLYIAAPWIRKDDMTGIASQFEDYDHTITHAWWDVENTPESDRTVHTLREQAILDVQGVLQADAMVLINSSKSEGKSLEQGIAIANNLPIIAVGKRGEFSKNVFHYLDNYIWVDSIEEALEALEDVDDNP